MQSHKQLSVGGSGLLSRRSLLKCIGIGVSGFPKGPAALLRSESPIALRFGIQGDIHNYSRIPEPYLKRMVADASNANAEFVAILGDSLTKTKPNPMELGHSSAVPILWHPGDHEFFGDWGRTQGRTYSNWKLSGEENDPLTLMRGGLTRQESLLGLPPAWSFDLQDIHFVLCFCGKGVVWTNWFLQWLRRDLDDHREQTTVLLSHRRLWEAGETGDALRSLVRESPQVRLICHAHGHRGEPFEKVGNCLMVNTEADKSEGEQTFEDDWYTMVEIVPEAIRILRRRMNGGAEDLLYEEVLTTRLGETRPGFPARVTLAYPFSDRGVRFNPAVWMTNARLRVTGLDQEQLVPEPGERSWVLASGVSADSVTPSSGAERNPGWQALGIERVWKLRPTPSNGSGFRELFRVRVPVRFESDPEKVGVTGTMRGIGTQYSSLLLTRMPQGRKARLLVEAFRADQSCESRHWVDGKGGSGLTLLQALTGHSKLEMGRPWRWIGVEGKTEVTGQPDEPRRAVRLELSFQVESCAPGDEYEVAVLMFPGGGFFTAVPAGKRSSRQVSVRVGDREFQAGDLSEKQSRVFELGEVPGGEPLRLHCSGSRLAVVELIGETPGIMQGTVRSVTRPDGRWEIGGLPPGASGPAGVEPWKRQGRVWYFSETGPARWQSIPEVELGQS